MTLHTDGGHCPI